MWTMIKKMVLLGQHGQLLPPVYFEWRDHSADSISNYWFAEICNWYELLCQCEELSIYCGSGIWKLFLKWCQFNQRTKSIIYWPAPIRFLSHLYTACTRKGKVRQLIYLFRFIWHISYTHWTLNYIQRQNRENKGSLPNALKVCHLYTLKENFKHIWKEKKEDENHVSKMTKRHERLN